MATEVDICNMALSFLGDRATLTSIDPPEGSAQAEHCARFYPMALQELLSVMPWSFATKRSELAEFSDEIPGTAFAYALPFDCLSIQAVYSKSGRIMNKWTLERAGVARGILTDEPISYVRYTSVDVPSSIFSPTFALALAHLLASKLAGSMVTGSSGQELAQAQIKLYELYMNKAKLEDARQSNESASIRQVFMGDYSDGNPYGNF